MTFSEQFFISAESHLLLLPDLVLDGGTEIWVSRQEAGSPVIIHVKKNSMEIPIK